MFIECTCTLRMHHQQDHFSVYNGVAAVAVLSASAAHSISVTFAAFAVGNSAITGSTSDVVAACGNAATQSVSAKLNSSVMF